MGAGKSCVGRRLADALGLAFRDSDEEVEKAAGCKVKDIFDAYGELAFRDCERRVIQRLLDGGPCVLATGGGAFMDLNTRALIRDTAVSVWLRADPDVLFQRTRKNKNRPLLNNDDPLGTLKRLAGERYPTYAEADIVIDTGNEPVDATVARLRDMLEGKSMQDAAKDHETLRVDLGDRSYDIHVGAGLIGRAGELLVGVLAAPRTVIVTDELVAPHWLTPLQDSLSAAGISSRAIVVPPGEETKSLAWVEKVTDDLLQHGLDRKMTLIALGGGVVGDLTGFCAAIALRGVDFVQIPTTLLAQVDSSVGGKTGIDTRFGKNLIGAFHQPRAVIADTAALDTLPRRELLCGYAEVVKYGVINDRPFFDWLVADGHKLIDGDESARRRAVVESCKNKAAVVSADERESGLRALLNLGHTFGHAVEAQYGFGDGLKHGEAVAIGMAMALDMSVAKGICDAADRDALIAHLAAVGLPTGLSGIAGTNWTSDALLDHMGRDKKTEGGKLTFILANGIGQSFVARDVDAAQVKSVLDGYLAAAKAA